MIVKNILEDSPFWDFHVNRITFEILIFCFDYRYSIKRIKLQKNSPISHYHYFHPSCFIFCLCIIMFNGHVFLTYTHSPTLTHLRENNIYIYIERERERRYRELKLTEAFRELNSQNISNHFNIFIYPSP
jgi:hypothetical protein